MASRTASMPLVKMVRPSVAQPDCKPPMGLGRASTRGSCFAGGCVGGPGVDRRVPDELAVVGPQDVEAAVLAAGADDLGRLAVHVDGEDLRRVADRLVLVEPGLRVVGAHRVGPHVAGIDLRAPLALAGRGVERGDRAGVLRVEGRVVGRRLPRRSVHVRAEEQRVGFGIVRRRGPDAARRGTVLELVLAPGAFHDDRRIELLRLRADVVLPDHLAGPRVERDEEAAAGAAGVHRGAARKSCSSVPPPNTTLPSAMIGEAMNRLFQWAPGNAGRAAVRPSSARLRCAASRQYIQPPVSAKYTAPSATSAEEKIPASDAAAAQLFGNGRTVRRRQHGLADGIAVHPAELAIGRQLVEGRERGGAEVDLPGDHGGRGVNDADGLLGVRGGESPFLDELADVGRAERFLGGIEAPAGQVVVVHRPVGGRVRWGNRPLARGRWAGRRTQFMPTGQKEQAHHRRVRLLHETSPHKTQSLDAKLIMIPDPSRVRGRTPRKVPLVGRAAFKSVAQHIHGVFD